ncbi:MAG: hypothetical protein AB7S55_06350 [Thiomonas sp.]
MSLIVARILLALLILAGVLFLIDTGLNAAGLHLPTVREIAQRARPALHDLQPLLARVQRAAGGPTTPESAPASASR